MQLGQFDRDLQRGIGGVGIVHHAVHAEILDGVRDVRDAAPPATDQIGEDLHRHLVGLVADQLVQQRDLVRHRTRWVGEGAFEPDVVIEHIGDREQFIADTPRQLAGLPKLGGQRVTRDAVGYA